MLNLRRCLAVLAVQAVAACSVLEPVPAPTPAPPPAPVPAPAPPPVADDLPYPPLPAQTAQKPVPKPRPAAATTTTAKPAKVAPAKTIKPTEEPGHDAEPPRPLADDAAPLASESAATRRPTRKLASAPAPAISGPEWLQYCSYRQQSPTGVLCDANTLLAQPSAKVQVYVREPSLARDTPGGRIVLREGLPKLYRFFVLP